MDIENGEFKQAQMNEIGISGIQVAWHLEQGTCTFKKLPVAMMWVDTTLAGLMSGIQAMVGTEHFVLALQSEGRKSVEADWQVISKFTDFREGFKAIANIATVAGWGNWELTFLDQEQKEGRFRVKNSWEGCYQKALGVCWGSGMVAGKMAGYCSKLFGTNCWADQTTFIAKGDAYDEFVVKPSPRSIETEIKNLLASDEATRTDMAVALRKLEQEIAERRRMQEALQESEKQAKQMAQEKAAVAEIGRIISSNLNIDEVYERFAEEVRKLILFDRIVIDLIHPEKNSITIAYTAGVEIPGRRNGDILSLIGSDDEYLLKSQAALLLQAEDEEEVATHYPILLPTYRAGFRSMMSVPLISKDQVIGGLHFRTFKPKAYGEKDLGLAERVGTQIAGTIANAQLFIERVRAEEALWLNEKRLRQIIDLVPHFIFAKDESGKFILINKAVADAHGTTVEELTGKTVVGFARSEEEVLHFLKDDHEVIDSGMPKLIPEERVTDTTGKVRILSTVKIPFTFSGTASRSLLGVSVDITERKGAEEALRRNLELMRNMGQENAIMAEIGRIISSSLNIEEVYQRFAEKVYELIHFDRIVINIINPKDYTATRAYLTGIELTGRGRGEIFPLAGTFTEEIVRSRKGSLITTGGLESFTDKFPRFLKGFKTGILSIISVPLISRDEVIGVLHMRSTKPNAYSESDLRLAERVGNQIAGAIANAQLFAERKRAEEERERLEKRLRRVEKMEALGILAGGVAHDLNNILGVLVGYSELLQIEIGETSPLRKDVSHILGASKRAAAVIQDLLTLARRGVSVSQVVNLNEVFLDCLEAPEYEKLRAYHPQVTFRNKLGKELMNIKGSPVHLSKTIINLLSNAAEAISGQGEVVVETENCYLERPIRGYDDVQEGDYVVVRVVDNGKGISAEDIGKIFEPFYTKKVMGRSGTGLGLAVVWGTVKDHSGYIDVQSEEGKGSTFTLYFPVTREEKVSDQGGISAESYMGSGESILVVDDVKEQRELATDMLSGLGYRVSSVSSGEEAVAYLRTNRIDLLVLDMIMDPGMDGLETYQIVLDINPRQKAIIASGYSETDRVKKAQELGAGAYVRKPYIREKIGLAIRRELDK